MFQINDIKDVLSQATGQTLSLYLNVDNATQENQADQPAWRIWLKDILNSMSSAIGKEQKDTWSQVVEHLETYLEDYQPTSKGLALFVTPENGVQAFELPFPFENHMSYGKPQVMPLLWAIDEYEPYIVALVDQEEARFFTSYLGAIGFQESVERSEDIAEWRDRTIMSNPAPGVDHGAVHGGSGRDDFEKRMDAQRERLYRDAADHIERLMRKYGAERLILAGAEQAAHGVLNVLPERLKSGVSGIVPAPLYETPQQIFDRVLPVAQDFERKQEIELVKQVMDMANAGGRGALGRKAVNEAMDMQRVELLIMAWPSADEAASIEMAIRALGLNSKIELVHGEAADLLQPNEGIAARLYYTL